MLTQWLAAMSVAGAIGLSGRPPPVSRLPACRAVAMPVHDTRPVGSSRWAVVAATAAGSGLVAGVTPVLVAGWAVGWLVVRRVIASRRASQARNACALATVEVTFALAGELRAGRTTAQALAAVADLAGPLQPALHAAHRAAVVGSSPAEELARAATLPGAQRLQAVAAAWAIAESAGGRIAIVLERMSESMDSDDELRQELDAAMAGPRATMTLLAGLPLLGLALGQAVGARPVALLLHRPLGWGLLAAALVLDGLGVIVMRAVTARALRG